MRLLENLQSQLDDLLQKDVSFKINEKVLNEGKIILFNVKDFYIIFTLITKKGLTKNYEIPIPYQINNTPDSVLFEYNINHIVKGDKNTHNMIDNLIDKVGKKSKFLDSTLTIEF